MWRDGSSGPYASSCRGWPLASLARSYAACIRGLAADMSANRTAAVIQVNSSAATAKSAVPVTATKVAFTVSLRNLGGRTIDITRHRRQVPQT